MPSLAELANQVNSTLDQIKTNTLDAATTVGLIKGDTADIGARLDDTNGKLDGLTSAVASGLSALRGLVASGVAHVGAGLYAQLETLRVTNAHLWTTVEQNDAVLCWLGTIAELECRQVRLLEASLEAQRAAAASLADIAGLLQVVHPREQGEWQRYTALSGRIAACCDRPQPEPRACFEPCAPPEVHRYDPKGQGFEPVDVKGLLRSKDGAVESKGG